MKKRMPTFTVPCVALAIMMATLIAGLQPAIAQESDDELENLEDSGERCIVTRRISRTKVVDDRTIIFYMRGGGDTYVNILPRPCNGLARENRFSYQAQGNRLCDIDGIVVLYPAGATLRPGANCRLGLFHPITREDAEAIIEGPQAPPAAPLPMPEPEEVGESEAEPESP